MDLKYDVEADWELLTTCNFRCDYCYWPAADLGAKMVTHGTHAQWVEGFNATGKTWLLHITGGEPTIYPDFTGLCEQLSQRHFLSINSNLSHQCMDAFAERIDPKQVHYINTAVHYDERQKKTSLDVFIKRVRKLREHHFNVLVNLVMTPMMLSTFPQLSEYFESHGLYLIPKVLRNMYQGKMYPAAYSADQKALFFEYSAKAKQNYAPVIERMGEPATIDMFADERIINATGNYHGKLCGSGYNFVKIEKDGSLYRCGSGERLGNILQKNTRLLRAPKVCDTSYCPYFCEKYTSPQFTRKDHRNKILELIERFRI
jgi:MoaA/NifB/PqqE/SkfB family radical SAM enzyme